MQWPKHQHAQVAWKQLVSLSCSSSVTSQQQVTRRERRANDVREMLFFIHVHDKKVLNQSECCISEITNAKIIKNPEFKTRVTRVTRPVIRNSHLFQGKNSKSLLARQKWRYHRRIASYFLIRHLMRLKYHGQREGHSIREVTSSVFFVRK